MMHCRAGRSTGKRRESSNCVTRMSALFMPHLEEWALAAPSGVGPVLAGVVVEAHGSCIVRI